MVTYWKTQNIPLSQFKLVADSWYPSQALLTLCRDLSLEAIGEGKASYSFTIEDKKVKAATLKEQPLKASWGEQNKALRSASLPPQVRFRCCLWSLPTRGVRWQPHSIGEPTKS